MNSYLYSLIPVMFLIAFPALWSGIVFVASRLAWARYASEFATDHGKPGSGDSGRFQSLHFGPMFFGVNYNGIVTLSTSAQGLFLAPSIFLFRPGHSDLLIPWNRIDAIKTGKFLWLDTNTLDVGGGLPRMTIYRAIGNAVRARWEAETGARARA